MSIGSPEPVATAPAGNPVAPVVETKKPTPVNYASYSKQGSTRAAGSVNYAMYGNSGDENFVDVGGVNYATYAGRIKTPTGQEAQNIINSPEYTPEQLQDIIDLLGIIELSKTLLPEIANWAKRVGGPSADIVQTGGVALIKKELHNRFDKQKTSNNGKSSMVMKFGKFLLNNAELLIELYRSKEILNKAESLSLSGVNKAKVLARHTIDGLFSKLGLAGQAADFFFNSSLKSVGALEDQIATHKKKLRTYYGVPESYIDEPSKGLEYYKDLQVKLYHG